MFGAFCILHERTHEFASYAEDRRACGQLVVGLRLEKQNEGRSASPFQDDVKVTLGPSLMEGGMLWDECNIPALLDELLWVAQNQPCTNEAIAYQLPSIIDILEVWVEEHGERLSASGNNANYCQTIKQGIQELRNLGCKCIRGCTKNCDCPCRIQARRCSAWCSKHPTLPRYGKNQIRQCMYDA